MSYVVEQLLRTVYYSSDQQTNNILQSIIQVNNNEIISDKIILKLAQYQRRLQDWMSG